jgi:hypothetical protein
MNAQCKPCIASRAVTGGTAAAKLQDKFSSTRVIKQRCFKTTVDVSWFCTCVWTLPGLIQDSCKAVAARATPLHAPEVLNTLVLTDDNHQASQLEDWVMGNGRRRRYIRAANEGGQGGGIEVAAAVSHVNATVDIYSAKRI